MARFYTSTTNSRGNPVTAMGRKDGQSVHTRGWNLGVRVISRVDEHDRDVFEIYRTGGSNDGGASHLIGTLVADTFVPAPARAANALTDNELQTLMGAR